MNAPSGRPLWQKYLGLLGIPALVTFVALYLITGSAALAGIFAAVVIVVGVIGGVIAVIFGALRDRTRRR